MRPLVSESIVLPAQFPLCVEPPPVQPRNRARGTKGRLDIAFSTTAEFSSFSSEQVEYTSLPPGETRCIADLQDGQLARLKIRQVFELEPPFDLGIASQRTRARAGHVSQYAVEEGGCRKLSGIGGDHLNVGRGNQFAQHARAVRMQFRRNDAGVRIARRERSRFAAGRSAAVQYA